MMIKIVQFGEGNFLRSFADLYFQALNEEGGDYGIHIVKPIPFGSLDLFRMQDNRYHVVLRGMKDGRAAEDVYEVTAVKSAISPFEEEDRYLALARDPELKLIISNTTEAGICFNPEDGFEDLAAMTFPGKLTKFLLERFNAGLDGVYLLPVELIENNADALYRCVNAYIDLWDLPESFREWNDAGNFYCNTLVDRIVSGYPREAALKAHLFEQIGQPDELVSVAEPFGLWAVEKKGDIARYIAEGVHNIEVVLTEDIAYYKKRKVRVLNGSHTNLVSAGLCLGKETVYDFMEDPALCAFFQNTLEEIIPFVSEDEAMTRRFAAAVEQRFRNPYLNHQLTSIALNSISKWRARNLPTFKDYYERNGVIPPYMTVGFSYLMYMYKTRYESLLDDAENLEYFAAGKSVEGFMANADVWGEDLTAYPGFAEAVLQNICRIEKGERLV